MVSCFNLLEVDEITVDQPFCDPSKKMDFLIEYLCQDSNPNGDPDLNGAPRMDSDDYGIVSSQSIKRKIRNFVELHFPDQQNWITEGAILGTALKELGGKKNGDIKSDMLRKFWDVRMFGAVLAGNKENAGALLGPMQINIGRSLDPIVIADMALTRCASTNVETKKSKADTESDDPETKANQTMGRRSFVSGSALYRQSGHFSAAIAEKQGIVSADDMRMFWIALKHIFEESHSASRGMIGMTKIFVWTHDKKYGDRPAYALFDEV